MNRFLFVTNFTISMDNNNNNNNWSDHKFTGPGAFTMVEHDSGW